MQFCSKYARDCLSKCCDRFGDCPEYSGNSCYHFYAGQNSSSWPSEHVFMWIVYALAGIISLIALWYCCCRNNKQQGMYGGQSFIQPVGDTMTSGGPVAGIIVNNQMQTNQMAGSMIMNTLGAMGASPVVGQPQITPMGVGGVAGNSLATSGIMQNSNSMSQQQIANMRASQQQQQQQFASMQNQMTETSGYGQDIDAMVPSPPPILTSNKRMAQTTSSVTQSPISQGPRLM